MLREGNRRRRSGRAEKYIKLLLRLTMREQQKSQSFVAMEGSLAASAASGDTPFLTAAALRRASSAETAATRRRGNEAAIDRDVLALAHLTRRKEAAVLRCSQPGDCSSSKWKLLPSTRVGDRVREARSHAHLSEPWTLVELECSVVGQTGFGDLLCSVVRSGREGCKGRWTGDLNETRRIELRSELVLVFPQ